ncbi:branched-chain amino acid ABC transporter permease [Paraburkholderia antibiotica]|uniref:Branched-chain amino acid ABC transporter permease n=1 Tax=Paraburkholderia antibiotica TaxID=2728839 RepID=A0A7Y0A1M4_9BURK|nr:branched-chain amino acid ABC transporter permease [Paraburkholderia antibiotica]NML34799.1 branched-chain amino acid ABC transporter permease [Paraburkholderia antibiotica]
MMPSSVSAARATRAQGAAGAMGRRVSYVDRLGWLLAVLLLAVPAYAALTGQPFLVVLFARIAIFAIAALSLDLMLGVGGLVSFGHALYFGLGAYATGMLAQHGVASGTLHLAVTLAACALVALVTGAIALRTSGIAFIMITLAFAQMFYFFAVSLREYGGDDGFALANASRFGGVSLGDSISLYYVAAGLLVALLLFGRRFLKSAAGMTLGGIRINERRMRALGVPATQMKLAVYVIAAMLCGVAGMLFANLTQFVAPSYMSWTMSGDLIVMVVIGGAGSFVGPLLGTLVMVLLEEGLKSVTEHWMLVMGPLIVIAVLLSRRGLIGLAYALDARRERSRASQGGAQ